MQPERFTANDTGRPFNISGDPTKNVTVHGAFGSGTIKIQISGGLNASGVEKWFDVATASWTADTRAVLTLPPGRYQWVLSGATTPEIMAMVGE